MKTVEEQVKDVESKNEPINPQTLLKKVEDKVEIKSTDDLKKTKEVKVVEIVLKPKQLNIILEVRKSIDMLQQTIQLQQAREQDIVTFVMENADIDGANVDNVGLKDGKIVITLKPE